MRRFPFLASVLALAAALALAHAAPGVGADEEHDLAAHPLVGSWVVDTDADNPNNAPAYATFHADGTFFTVDPAFGVGVGAWRATGDRTADLTILFQDVDPTPAVVPGELAVRAAVEANAGGDGFTAEYATTARPANGPEAPAASGVAIAERMEVAPMAPAGAPAATPAAAAGGAEVVTVDLTDYRVDLSRTTFRAGQPYAFRVTNHGGDVHEFVIERAGIADEPLEAGDREAEVEDIAPGAAGSLTWTFAEPGRYQLACHRPGHYEAGMVVEVEVTE